MFQKISNFFGKFCNRGKKIRTYRVKGLDSKMTGGASLEDNRIIELYFDRNEIAIAETKNKFGRLCFGISKNILGDESDAEECVNDTYLAVWNKIPPERPNSLMAFVAKIARNISLKRLERNSAQKRRAFEYVDISELEEVLADDESAAGVTEEEIGRHINDFLSMEKEAVRNVFMRKYWFFDSVEEIADRYSFSESKVKSILFHTRNKLRRYLKEKGVHI